MLRALGKISNKFHKKIMDRYLYRDASTPLITEFHKIDRIESISEAMMFDLTPAFLADVVYRYYMESNLVMLIYGYRGTYKSHIGKIVRSVCCEVGGIPFDDSFK